MIGCGKRACFSNAIKYFLELTTSQLNPISFIQISCGISLYHCFSQLAGVPQGGILSPLLFLAYTADIPRHLNIASICLQMVPSSLQCTKIYLCPTPFKNIYSSSNLSSSSRKLKLTRKSHFTYSLRKQSCPQATLKDVTVSQESHISYLGLDKRLTWKSHIIQKR